jgi:sugar-specific transcriptional regulator TrmB
MKRLLKLLATVLVFVMAFSVHSSAQSFENAGEYMDYIFKANNELTEKYLTYLSAVSHGKSTRKVEKRRQEVVNAISDTRFNIMGMLPFKGDRTLKDTTVAYLKILNYIFNDQYGKIVNMEEIAEQSYDAMEAYLLAQEKAQEKLEEASLKQHETQKLFAKKNNINLVEGENEVSAKMKTANQVLKHADETYLIFFKCYKQEAYLIDAMNRKNLVGIEQNNNSLKKFAEEGLEKLNNLKGYNNDPSLIVACRDLMNFYKKEAGKGSALSDFYLKEENFNKLKKQFDAKPSSRRTQQDVDQYNKAVNDLNAAMNDFNKTNNELNKERTSVINNWEKLYKKYMDTYIPTQR